MACKIHLKWFSMIGRALLLLLTLQNVAAEDKTSSTTITALDLIELRELSGMAGNGLTISPDGNYAAFEIHQADVGTDSYQVDWYILSLKSGGQVTRIADGGDPLLFRNGYGGAVNGDWGPKEAKWSPDSKRITYLRQERGAVQIWRSSIDGSPPAQMTKNAADVEDFFWSEGGRKIYFRTDAARTVIKEAEQQRAAKGYRVEENFIPAYPSRLRIGDPYELLGGEPDIWTFDVKTGREQKASPEERKTFEQLAGQELLPTRPEARRVTFSRDKYHVAWLENNAPQKNPGIDPPLTLFSSGMTENSKEIICTAPECTGWFDGLWWRRDEVIFQKREGLQLSHRALYAWNRNTGKVRWIYSTTDWLSGCNVTGHRAICYLETPTKPRRIVAIDLERGILKVVFNPNPNFDEIRLGKVERLEWTNAHGVGTWGYLVKPRDFIPGRRYPLIIVQYRPSLCLRGGVGDEYPTHLFSAQGFMVLCFNQPENYDIFAQSIDAYDAWKREWTGNIRQRQILSSLETIIDRLDKQGLIDPARVGITGLSAGSEAVQFAVINSNAFAAAAFSSPAFEPILNYTLSEKLREGLLKPAGFGRPGTDQGYNWPAMSLSMNADRITTPLLIQASDHEYISALQSLVGLREAGNAIDMYVFPDEYHIKWSPKHRFYIYQRNIDWFNFWLRGVKDNDPAKALQYKHWDGLRRASSPAASPKIPITGSEMPGN